jgi:tetratricopeptide (TPR) repeat protein
MKIKSCALIVPIVAVAICAFSVFLWNRTNFESSGAGALAPLIPKTGSINHEQAPRAMGERASGQSNPEISNQKESRKADLALTSGNFEGDVQKCFSGDNCILEDDPWKMYGDFKKANNQSAEDNLIAFMRSKLSDEEFRALYKEKLKKMIIDFYPPEERLFQVAAFYNYVGELENSLSVYKDLETKSEANPNLRPAPKLNIANTLFDLRRYREALPYYEMALRENLENSPQVMNPSQNEMARFIEDRISAIKKLL